MSRKTFIILFVILWVAIGALIGMTIARENEYTWTTCYEMVNKHIEWSGAGYNGIYVGNAD